jgi:hypothetical protein
MLILGNEYEKKTEACLFTVPVQSYQAHGSDQGGADGSSAAQPMVKVVTPGAAELADPSTAQHKQSSSRQLAHGYDETDVSTVNLS